MWNGPGSLTSPILETSAAAQYNQPIPVNNVGPPPLASSPAAPHWRCFSTNGNYNHAEVHPVLSQVEMHPRILEIEVVFHVLAPLPGFRTPE